jgi:peptidyl-prolyl cis-trans isomerase A (cyclophilin A)
MFRPIIRPLLLGLLLVLPASAQQSNPHVLLHTQLGDIEVELDTVQAPSTTANFLRYVNGGFYDGGAFHRTVTPQNQPDKPIKIEVVQAAINPDRTKDSFPPIALERTSITGLHHTYGTLSMARSLPIRLHRIFISVSANSPNSTSPANETPMARVSRYLVM